MAKQLPFALIVSFAYIVPDYHDETFRVDMPRHLDPLLYDESRLQDYIDIKVLGYMHRKLHNKSCHHTCTYRDSIVVETTLALCVESTEVARP